MGLLRTAAHVHVATAVHGRVQRRQAQRWADQAPAAPAAPAAASSTDVQFAQLKQLGELKEAGILTQAEFDAKKAQILGV